MYKTIFFLVLCLFSTALFAQRERVTRAFKDTRVVNIHSVETLPKGKLDVRIAHRFGDMFGDNGGWATFYGLEQATDVAIGAEYGFTNRFTAGIYRAKGGGSTPSGASGLQQNLNAVLKARLFYQEEKGHPVSAAFVGTTTFSAAQRLENAPNAVASFPLFSHRFAFNGSLVVSRKFSKAFAFQVVPGVTHRNLVPFEGENTLYSLGVGARVQITRVMALVADGTYLFSSELTSENGYHLPVGLGIEWDTGGHVFQLNFTNATGIFETDYIPYTTTNWGEGEFRIGFTISRWFNL